MLFFPAIFPVLFVPTSQGPCLMHSISLISEAVESLGTKFAISYCLTEYMNKSVILPLKKKKEKRMKKKEKENI